MTVDPKAAHPPPQPTPADPPAGSPASPNGFALLAKRLSNWTTNCIVTALVLVLGLGFGRQVIRWWTLDAPGAGGSQKLLELGDGLGDLGRPHEIRFGQSTWRLRREPAVGSREQAVAGLRASCRRAAQSSDLPAGSAAQGEQRLLDSLRQRSPSDRESGKWGVYELDDHFPMVVGVREAQQTSVPSVGQSVAQKGCRVVTWGLAVPMSSGAWTLYTFHQTTPSLGKSPEFGLPPNSSVILSLATEGGGALTAVRGPGGAEVWKSFYDQWFATHDWTAAEGWRRWGPSWSRCYVERPEGPAGKTEVQFGEDGRGGMSGLLMFTPAGDQSQGK